MRLLFSRVVRSDCLRLHFSRLGGDCLGLPFFLVWHNGECLRRLFSRCRHGEDNFSRVLRGDCLMLPFSRFVQRDSLRIPFSRLGHGSCSRLPLSRLVRSDCLRLRFSRVGGDCLGLPFSCLAQW